MPTMYQPTCFIIMPFRKKKGKENIEFDFDMIYEKLIKPAVIKAGFKPVRADEEVVDNIIHKAMYERLILCDYAIADLSTGNANVYYELGMRHTVKPYSTVCIMSTATQLEFDLNLNRTYPYQIAADGKLQNIAKDIDAIATKLETAKHEKITDSPVYQLVEGIHFQNSLAHEKTDIFRDRVVYETKLKDELFVIRTHKPESERLGLLNDFIIALEPIENQETGVLIDVMLSYRAFGDWNGMIKWIESLPEYVHYSQMVQEQYGFALNRNNQRDKAEKVLLNLIDKNGANPETNGILGRVYKDWADEFQNQPGKYDGYIDKAIESYLLGFESDMRDAYPGINAVNLLFQTDDDRYKKYIGTVELAVLQKMKTKIPDYWDYATLMELAVINNDQKVANFYLRKAVSTLTEPWMFETTIKTLQKTITIFDQRGENSDWVKELITHLNSN